MSIKALERHLQPLLPYLNQEGVTEICINQPGGVFVERYRQFQYYPIPEFTYDFLLALAALTAEYNNKPFPYPLIAGSLPNGERIQWVMPPACENQNIIAAIRRHQLRDMSLENYEELGAFAALSPTAPLTPPIIDQQLITLYQQGEITDFIRLAMLAKKNIIISGGTGTGKTTFLNACLKLIPDEERLITVEDTREVHVKQPNAVHLLFYEDSEIINALAMFKVCLRLRPDRLFLSELRGKEAWPYLRAANSGHPGSLTTVHADTPRGCFEQIGFMMQQAGSTATTTQLRAYIQSIVHIIIQLKRGTGDEPFMRVSEIYVDALHREAL